MLLCHSRELFAGSSWCSTRTNWISRMSSSTLLKQFARKMTRSELSSTRYWLLISSNKNRNLSSKQADMMTHQQLMRVYGALLWSLSKILGNPEVGGCHVLFVHTGRALSPITTRWKMYWLIVFFRSAGCTLEVSGASPSDMLPIENCLKLSRF